MPEQHKKGKLGMGNKSKVFRALGKSSKKTKNKNHYYR